MKTENKGVWGTRTPPEMEGRNKEVSVSPRKSVNIHSPLKDTPTTKPENTDKDTIFKRVTAFGSKVTSLVKKPEKVWKGEEDCLKRLIIWRMRLTEYETKCLN